MIYWIVFISSMIFTYLALKIKKGKGWDRSLFYLLAVLPPCMLAGIRDNYIGTDMQIYILPIYKIALNSSSFKIFMLTSAKKLEIEDILYLVVNYFVAKVFDSRIVLLFLIELLILLPIYIALIRENHNKFSVIVGLFVFYCFMYNASYNMARQSIALSFEILALSYLNKDDNKKFICFAIISAMFHSTAIFLLVVYFIFRFYKTKKISSKHKMMLLFIALVLVSVMTVNIIQVSNIAYQFGFISEKRFSSIQFWTRDADFSYVNTCLYLLILLIISVNYHYLMKNNSKTKVYRYLLIMGIVLSQAGVFVTFADRIAYYFIYPVIFFLLPQIAAISSKFISKKRFISALLIITLFLGYWGFWIGLLNYHDTLPYIFYKG